MTAAEAIRAIRQQASFDQLVADAYLGEDPLVEASRFAVSAEFNSIVRLLGTRVHGARILDVGSGRGIAAYAFALHGAGVVYALEPDPSVEAGRGALEVLSGNFPTDLVILDAYGESIPLPNESIDVVYARQVLHHSRSLDELVLECARVLRRGGVFLACREHVIWRTRDLKRFLRDHPLHWMTGLENAHTLETYIRAINEAGLRLERTLGPWDDVINAFPAARDAHALEHYVDDALTRRLRRCGHLLGRVPGVTALAWLWIRRRRAGDLYSFLAVKPEDAG